MSTDAWWLRGPEPATVAADPDLPVVVDPPRGPVDPHEGVTLVLTPEPPPVTRPPAPPAVSAPPLTSPLVTAPPVTAPPVTAPPDTAPPVAPPAPARSADAAAPAPSAEPATTASPGRRRTVLAAIAGVAVVVAGSATVATVLSRGDGTRGPRDVPAAAVAVPVDPAAVTATATSTQDPEGGTGYDAANTLDGDLATAWNSDGAATGRPGARPVSLTYTFARPVDLRSVVVRNGYQKVRRRTGKPPVDLYPANARVHRVRVVTDAGAWTWDLADVRAPQAFTAATGRTARVRLEVVSVYPSRTYPDVAVSEVAFTALPPTS